MELPGKVKKNTVLKMSRFGNEILGKTVSLRPVRKIARDKKISIDM